MTDFLNEKAAITQPITNVQPMSQSSRIPPSRDFKVG